MPAQNPRDVTPFVRENFLSRIPTCHLSTAVEPRTGAAHGSWPATAPRDLSGKVAFLTRALKAPTLRESVQCLAERARAASWSHEEFLVACLQREVSARESHGGEGRVRAARFPARKSPEEFDFDNARGLKRDAISPLGTLGPCHRQRERGVPWTTRHRQDPTSRSGWASAPAKPGTGCCLPPPRNGSPASPETRRYGLIASSIGRPSASRAVGMANGRNPISIIVPCHRVIGANGALVGYGAGVERKRWLLAMEGALLAS